MDKDEIYFTGPSKIERTQKFSRIYGTDGANSQVRKELLKLVSNPKESMDLINAEYKELFMPAADAGKYAIEKNALHIWPRGNHMLMALPNLDGSFTMTLYLPRTGENSFETLKTKEDLQSYFERITHGPPIPSFSTRIHKSSHQSSSSFSLSLSEELSGEAFGS